jgi:hypothetical protein
MRSKVKALIGLYQCVAAVPSVLNVDPPRGLEEYVKWINILEMPADLENMILPTSCFGEYRTRLWIGSTWPIALLLILAMGPVGLELARDRRRAKSSLAAPRGTRAAVLIGLQPVLPLTLGLTFLLVPSTSTRVFKTFLCDRIEYSDGDVRSYLYADLAISCTSNGYNRTRQLAIVMIAVWPVGIPLLYVTLLWGSRSALLSGIPTPLSRATTFLYDDYAPAGFLWEPLEMCRKLVLTGWILLISEKFEQARVVVCLLVCIGFLTLRISMKPQKR